MFDWINRKMGRFKKSPLERFNLKDKQDEKFPSKYSPPVDAIVFFQNIFDKHGIYIYI